jgi:hypothetical protein
MEHQKVASLRCAPALLLNTRDKRLYLLGTFMSDEENRVVNAASRAWPRVERLKGTPLLQALPYLQISDQAGKAYLASVGDEEKKSFIKLTPVTSSPSPSSCSIRHYTIQASR